MKIFKRIVLSFLAVLILAAVAGYIYFDQKFTPEKNYLTVEGESGKIPFTWLGKEKNVLLLPVNFPGDKDTYFLQFDTGSPYTLLYTKAIKNIKAVRIKDNRASTSFNIGKTKITSDKFRIFDQSAGDKENDTLKIIGTVGADILDGRKSIINFKDDYLSINLSKEPTQFQGKLFDFKFKKRKIIIRGTLKEKEENFLFDSGTSAYELVTNKEVWEDLKENDSKVIIEKSQSWQNVLTTFTTSCDQKIIFNQQEIPLHNITYVEGYSQIQYSLMKFSGMTGMLGNKIFLNSIIYIDCIGKKMGIE